MTSPVDTSVKFFSSDMVGAPVLQGQPGSLTDMLDALLINGFSTRSATSLGVSGGVATLGFTGGAHTAVVGSVITVSGATPSALNGEQKVTAVSSTTVSFATAQTDTTATGSISFKMAPLGMSTAFSGTNRRVYKQADPASSGMYLRVTDTDPATARVVGFISMADIDSGVGQFPKEDQQPGGLYWFKCYNAPQTVSMYWYLFGDARGFYICMSPFRISIYDPMIRSHAVYYFGDINSFKPGDPYAVHLSGSSVMTSNDGLMSMVNVNDSGAYLAKKHLGIGAPVSTDRFAYAPSTNGVYSGLSSHMGPFPSPVDYGLRLSKMVIAEYPVSLNGPRGELPGILFMPQLLIPGSFTSGDIIQGTGEFSTKRLMSVLSGGLQSQLSSAGVSFFDVTGPWRS